MVESVSVEVIPVSGALYDVIERGHVIRSLHPFIHLLLRIQSELSWGEKRDK